MRTSESPVGHSPRVSSTPVKDSPSNQKESPGIRPKGRFASLCEIDHKSHLNKIKNSVFHQSMSQAPSSSHDLMSPSQAQQWESHRDEIQKNIDTLIKQRKPSPKKIKKFCTNNELHLQGKSYKQWFKTRAMKNTHSHYYQTGAEVKADNIIDDMFSKLDEDGGGTLDCGEITALFKENGIHMSTE